ncbi:MAG: thiamine-phosphate kinase [Burkholderiaceae bacterium]|jgi:thiamine-monophosphate kinase
MGEFELIERYFARPLRPGSPFVLGGGDDCALMAPRSGYELAISSDMLVSGRHFFSDTDPEALGYKSLAVNLSDLAAMGAQPLGFTLALALTEAKPNWLEAFSRGLYGCADEFACELVGGDTTRGPLTIAITIFGELPRGSARLRSGARLGDDIWVSGHLGDAAFALAILEGRAHAPPEVLKAVRGALETPVPRVALGGLLRPLVHAMIDLSDGLAGDLGHVLKRSSLGARIELRSIPMGPELALQEPSLQLSCQLSGGDDYELCFTAAPHARAAIVSAGESQGLKLWRIGSTVAQKGIAFIEPDGSPVTLSPELTLKGFDHFG